MAPSYTYGRNTQLTRYTLISTFTTVLVIFLCTSYNANPSPVVDAGLIRPRQADSNICKRWAHQSAIINGTLYVYGGEASTDPTQTTNTNTWNNNFLSLDLSKTWDISGPLLSSLPQPSGPPAVALGTLWSSLESLFLYGGEFSSSPPVTPAPFALWEYNVPASTWTSYPAPSATPGPNANEAGPVQRAAEGAGASAAGLGRGWYFGGHLDGYTMPGLSQNIPQGRIYLKSLLEFQFPGVDNAPSSGSFRNVTEGGSQDSSGFPERADGVLIYVPNVGAQGILVGLAGGTGTTFTQLNVIDVYDIASSTWSKQSTAGPTPPIRVNPCAVAAVAPDGSSINVYMYGGQNLQPAGSQTQYSDVWILTIPSFRWISVDTSNDQSVPAPRAGHTCNIWDGQMVVVGGYVGQQLSCDSPGVYVFNLTSLTWTEAFTALSDSNENQLSKQPAQMSDPDALPGSYGYEVPTVVQHNVGGGPSGGATVTVPVVVGTAGPFATGSPKTYTVPGATATTTASPSNHDSGSLSTGADIAIAVSIVGGVLLAVIIYLAICAWLYRKRMRVYQYNMERARIALVEQRASLMQAPNANGYFGDGISPSSGLSSVPYSDDTQKIENTMSDSTKKEQNRVSVNKSSDDLLGRQEPSFVGIMLHPRRSLRVVNP